MRRTLGIPYTDRLAQVDHSHVIGTNGQHLVTQGDPYTFMVTIGRLACQDMPGSENNLNILTLGCKGSTPKPHVVQQPRSPADHVGPSDRITTSTRRQEVADVNIALYTMVLKEFGDSSGDEPSYSSVQHSLDPPNFEVTVSVQGRVFEGRARTKKQAKHLASQKACQSLGLSI